MDYKRRRQKPLKASSPGTRKQNKKDIININTNQRETLYRPWSRGGGGRGEEGGKEEEEDRSSHNGLLKNDYYVNHGTKPAALREQLGNGVSFTWSPGPWIEAESRTKSASPQILHLLYLVSLLLDRSMLIIYHRIIFILLLNVFYSHLHTIYDSYCVCMFNFSFYL